MLAGYGERYLSPRVQCCFAASRGGMVSCERSYTVLGVSNTAGNAEIKAAYRQLVKQRIPMLEAMTSRCWLSMRPGKFSGMPSAVRLSIARGHSPAERHRRRT